MGKIYTKTGDAGKTSLCGSDRVSKDDLRIEVLGELDELCSYIGVVLSFDCPDEMRIQLQVVQKHLYEVSSFVAGFCDFDVFAACNYLEEYIDALSEELPELTDFIAPGGESSAAYAYLARAVCRRAERRLVLVSKKYKELKSLITYVNRLSDFLFIVARSLNQHAGVSETVLKDVL